MKRRHIIIPALLLMLPAVTASATAAGQTKVTYQIDPAYEVEIPTISTIPFQTLRCNYGKIIIRKALLEPDKCIRVTMDTDGLLKNQESPRATIPYQILEGNSPFDGHIYTKTGEETELVISIAQEDWNRAASGEYSTSVIFHISYEDKE